MLPEVCGLCDKQKVGGAKLLANYRLWKLKEIVKQKCKQESFFVTLSDESNTISSNRLEHQFLNIERTRTCSYQNS